MDMIFKALNDPSRRALLDSLRIRDGQTLQQMEEGLEMTRFGVMKHLKLLEAAGLILTKKKGRFKYHYLNALPLQEVIDRWIEPLLQKPAARGILNLKTKLEGDTAMPATETMTKPDFMMETFIRTTVDALWDAIITGATMAKYHFASSRVEGDADSENGLVIYTEDGDVMLVQRATRVDPKTRVEMTFEPKWAGPDTAHSKCAYILVPQGDIVKLTVEHYEVPEGQDGIGEGWARWASSLKSFLETGTPLRAEG